MLENEDPRNRKHSRKGSAFGEKADFSQSMIKPETEQDDSEMMKSVRSETK